MGPSKAHPGLGGGGKISGNSEKEKEVGIVNELFFVEVKIHIQAD